MNIYVILVWSLYICFVTNALLFIGKQFAQGEQWTSLCDVLASKLMAAGNTLAAVLCYICAGNVDSTVEIWSRSLANERDGRSYAELLQVCITFYALH